MSSRDAKRPITIIQVAEACNVSTQTVSRVINNRPDVSPATRQRVLEAINRLNYQPNALARSLIHRRTNTIGVVTSGIDYFGPSSILMGIEQQASRMGYSLSLTLLHNPAATDGHEMLSGLVSRQVDGIIWAVPEIGDNLGWVAEKLERLSLPILFLNARSVKNATTIRIDNHHGSKVAVEHLLQQAHKKIGFITGPLDWLEAVERKKGWHDTLLANGITPCDDWIALGDWSARSGEQAMHQLLQQCPDLDAVFISNDQMALGALKAASELGRQVPQQLAIVGFDDIPEASYFQPPLSTIHQPLRELGVNAVKMLIQLIDEENGEAHSPTLQPMLLLPELVIRKSSL